MITEVSSTLPRFHPEGDSKPSYLFPLCSSWHQANRPSNPSRCLTAQPSVSPSKNRPHIPTVSLTICMQHSQCQARRRRLFNFRVCRLSHLTVISLVRLSTIGPASRRWLPKQHLCNVCALQNRSKWLKPGADCYVMSLQSSRWDSIMRSPSSAAIIRNCAMQHAFCLLLLQRAWHCHILETVLLTEAVAMKYKGSCSVSTTSAA